MQFPALTEARLLKRYKRFLADVRFGDGRVETVLVPNTGKLLGCIDEGTPVWLRPQLTSSTYRYSIVLVKPGRSLVCVDTSLPNRVVLDAARNQEIPQLAGYLEYIPEMPLGDASRVDLCCRVRTGRLLDRCWVEVKATTMVRGDCAMFPDAVTTRGRKHLVELTKRVNCGERAVQLFFVQRADCARFSPAVDIDPAYGEELQRAAEAGVEILALQAEVTKRGLSIKRQIAVEL